MEATGFLDVLWPIAAFVSAIGTVVGTILFSRHKQSGDYFELLEKENILLEKKLDDCERHRREMLWELDELKKELRARRLA